MSILHANPSRLVLYGRSGQRYHDGCCKQWVASWWRHQREPFPRYWPFVRGIHRSPVDSPHKGKGAVTMDLMLFFILVKTNGKTNRRDAGDLRRIRTHYDVILIIDSTVNTCIISHDLDLALATYLSRYSHWQHNMDEFEKPINLWFSEILLPFFSDYTLCNEVSQIYMLYKP